MAVVGAMGWQTDETIGHLDNRKHEYWKRMMYGHEHDMTQTSTWSYVYNQQRQPCGTRTPEHSTAMAFRFDLLVAYTITLPEHIRSCAHLPCDVFE